MIKPSQTSSPIGIQVIIALSDATRIRGPPMTVTPFAFYEPTEDRYYTARLDHDGQLVQLTAVSSLASAQRYCCDWGMEIPDPLPHRTLVFDPNSERVIDAERGTVNVYTPSPILRDALAAEPEPQIPPVADRLFDSLSAGDGPTKAHLLQWLAALIQHRRPLGTAWLFHGMPGSGKRLLLGVLTRILGPQHVVRWPTSELGRAKPPFAELEQALLLWLDPFDLATTKRRDRVLHRLDALIGNELLPHAAGAHRPVNHLNVIVSSDYPEPLSLRQDDQRLNVAPPSSRVLELTQDDCDRLLDEEVCALARYLAHHPVDMRAIRHVLDNTGRRELIDYSTQIDSLFHALRTGNLAFLLHVLEREARSAVVGDRKVTAFRRCLRRWCEDVVAQRRSRVFDRDSQLGAEVTAGHWLPRKHVREAMQRQGLRAKPLWDPANRKSDRGIELRFGKEHRPAAEAFLAATNRAGQPLSA